MAVKYLKSSAGGSGTGADWTNAYTTLAAAIAGIAAGDTLYVSQTHSENITTTTTFTFPGTAASPNRVICGNDGATPPTTIATGAIITSNNAISITLGGYFYMYGIVWKVGSAGASNAGITLVSGNVAAWQKYESCIFHLNNSSSSARLGFRTGGGVGKEDFMEFVNCKIRFGSTSQAFNAYTPFNWIGGSWCDTGSVPTNVFDASVNEGGHNCNIKGADLSAIGAAKYLVKVGNNSHDILFQNCKLNASLAGLYTGTFAGQGSQTVRAVNCDSGDTNYKYTKANYQGTITQDTSIYRSSGASDGTNNFSRVMASTANAKFESPLVLDDIVQWNETTGSSITVTIEVATNAVTLKDDELWLEVEYSSDASGTTYSVASSRVSDILQTGSNLSTSSVTWNSVPGSPTKQYASVSFTPGNKGPIFARVCLAKASTTVYVDPYLTIS